MNKISIILPCAGSGTRLGLEYPKELHEISENFRLIDFSLNHILQFKKDNPESDLRVVLVVRPHKESVFKYAEERLKNTGIEVIKEFFNEKYYDCAGSIYSANGYFGDLNIALLPDSVIRLAKDSVYIYESGKTLLAEMAEKMKNNDVVFAYQPCSDKEKLKALGALFVSGGKVLSFCDKPDKDFEKYNAFWTAYGFKRESGLPLYEFIRESVLHKNPDYSKQGFYPAAGLPVYSYCDLGTWDNIKAFLSKESISEYKI